MGSGLQGLWLLIRCFFDLKDKEALKKETRLIKQLGYDGKAVLDQSQMAIVHEVCANEKRDNV